MGVKDEVVKEKVAKKTGLRGGLFGSVFSAAANSFISDKSIINSMSSKLKANIESTVQKTGIDATVSKVFQQGRGFRLALLRTVGGDHRAGPGGGRNTGHTRENTAPGAPAGAFNGTVVGDNGLDNGVGTEAVNVDYWWWPLSEPGSREVDSPVAIDIVLRAPL
ncbi:unnamed protein product [Sphagnum balticum]